MYTRTMMVSTGVYKNPYIWSKVAENTVAVDLSIIIYCDFIVWTRPTVYLDSLVRRYTHFMRIRIP